MNTTSPVTEITFNCPHCGKKSKLANSISHSNVFTVSCYFCHGETDVRCKTDSNGAKSLIPEGPVPTFHKIELSFLPEETPLLKSPSAYASEKTYQPVILNMNDTSSEMESIHLETEQIDNRQQEEKKGFLKGLRDDLVEMLQIQTVETDSDIPIFSVVKQRKS
ncbi:MAG TPA: hypothetical protein PK079_00420 [Leptospiraceae bacterium]|nr:hypothetical protein [Leptospiraceae bacterium]HMW05214.1 hypothetical protein [Leptospiraceae bacterium]HMX31321.1 hypothetical protein [Leptospiraceae bacterium]HMY32127.1 hypothetical protein [Leptospiraceae bacterium]HMZ63492.1 hypothetical protein [Leptospiraceae bacterium]